MLFRSFWALSRAGFNAAQISRTTTAFLVLSNTVMTVMIFVLGVVIGSGLAAGHLHPALTWIPAAIALAVIITLLLFAKKGATFVPPPPDAAPDGPPPNGDWSMPPLVPPAPQPAPSRAPCSTGEPPDPASVCTPRFHPPTIKNHGRQDKKTFPQWPARWHQSA